MHVSFKALELGLSLLPVIGISLAPETYTEGGGILDDVNVTFLALKFRTSEGTPYDKPGSKTVPLLAVDMLPEGSTDVQTQYFSCGQLEHLEPSPNGETLVDKGGKGINKSSNVAVFLSSLVAAGLPKEKLTTEKISDLAGMVVHLVRNERKDNIKRKEGEKPASVLTVDRIISTPWGSVQSPAASPATTTAQQVAHNTTQAPAQAQGNGSVFDDGQLGILAMGILQANGGKLTKLQLTQEMYKAAVGGAIAPDAKDPNGQPARMTIGTRIMADAFLQSQPYWRYDGQNVTLIQ